MPDKAPFLNYEKEDFNLWQLLDFLKSGWYWLTGGAVLGLVGAVGFVLVVPPQYEAKAVIQPATVGVVGATTKGAEIESVALTLERLRMPTFYSENVLKACGVKNQTAPRQFLAKAVKPTLVKGNSLIEISYHAESPAVSEACVAEMVMQLSKIQAALAQPVISMLEGQLKLTKQQLEESERFLSQIEKRAITMDPSDAKFSQSMLMLNAVLSKREEILKLRKLYSEQSLMLAEPLTQPAKLFEPIYAPDQAVFPKKTLMLLGGLIVGFMLGGFALFVRQSLVARK